MHLSLARLLLAFPLAAPLPAMAEEANILDMFDHFVLSDAAARHCIQPDAELQKRFTINYLDVTNRAANHLQEQEPGLSRQGSAEMMRRRQADLTRRMQDLLEAQGCTGAEPQRWVRMYETEALWEPYAQSSRAP